MHQSLVCPHPKKWGRCGSKNCKPCNNWRRMKWIYRLEQENSVSVRTWFLTLTSSTVMTQDEWRHSWQKFMKKVRKSLIARNAEHISPELRYFAVQELGKKNSRRHCHALIFCSDTVGRRALENHWNHGFSNCKLVEPTHIRYVAKYIGKDTHRIMASQLLGLRLGTPSEAGHPSWYLRLRWQRLTKQHKPTLTVMHPSSEADNDRMDRQDAHNVIRAAGPKKRPTKHIPFSTSDVSRSDSGSRGTPRVRTEKETGRLG